MSMCQRGGLLGAVASTWREIDTSSSWTKNSTHFSLAWLSLGAPVLLLLYMVEGSFSAVIPGRNDTRDTKPTKPPPVALPASEAGYGGELVPGVWRRFFTSPWGVPTLRCLESTSQIHTKRVDSSQLNPSRRGGCAREGTGLHWAPGG